MSRSRHRPAFAASERTTPRGAAGRARSARGLPATVDDWGATPGMARALPWPMSSPLRSGEEFQNLSVQQVRSIVPRIAGMIGIRPVDVAGATFEIEPVRLAPQRNTGNRSLRGLIPKLSRS